MRASSILLAVLVATGLAAWFALHPGTGPRTERAAAGAVVSEFVTEAAPVPVVALDVRAEEVADTLTVRGRTEAERRVEVEAETTGRVISEPRRRGTRVGKGDVLCRLDPGSRPAQLAEARAMLAEAEAEARAAESLSAKGFTAETTRIGREAALQAAQAAVDLVALDIERLEIRAPFDGLLESDTAELGARLGVGDPCATVIDLSSIRVTGYVAEDLVDAIAEGRTATVRLVNGLTAEGEITFISRVADPETRTYEVEVTVPNADGRIRDGMTAEMRIDLPARTAHRIPQSALTLDDDGRLGVRLAQQGLARFVPVRILRDENRGVWVTGLPEHARVIVIGQEYVRDGRAVEATLTGWDALG